MLTACSATLSEGRSVLLAGPAGIGKTRVACELAEQAEGQMEVMRLAASVTAELPRSLLHADADRRTLVVVDDIHRLDDDSESLLHDLVVKNRVQLVATLRTGEPNRAATVTSLWKLDVLQRVDLGPLTRDDVDLLLDRVLDGPIDASTRLRFWEMTRGAPLYLRELVR